MLGLRFCARTFSSCGKWGPLFITVRGPLTIVASLVAEHRLQMCRLSSCGSRAQLLRGMWDLPRPGLEPVSPALAGRLSTTAPPRKPLLYFLEYFPLSTKSTFFKSFKIFCFHLVSCSTTSAPSSHPESEQKPWVRAVSRPGVLYQTLVTTISHRAITGPLSAAHKCTRE